MDKFFTSVRVMFNISGNDRAKLYSKFYKILKKVKIYLLTVLLQNQRKARETVISSPKIPFKKIFTSFQ